MTASLLDGLLNNATLTFRVGNGSVSFDPATGNPIESKTEVVISAKLDQKRDAPRNVERQQTNNLPSIWMEGYAIDPAILPPSINVTSVADAVISGQAGRFYMVPVIQLAAIEALDFRSLTGTKIAGWFEVSP